MDPVSVTAETETIRPCSGLLLDTSGVSSSIRISSMEQWRFNLLPVSTLTEEAASALCRLSRYELTMTEWNWPVSSPEAGIQQAPLWAISLWTRLEEELSALPPWDPRRMRLGGSPASCALDLPGCARIGEGEDGRVVVRFGRRRLTGSWSGRIWVD